MYYAIATYITVPNPKKSMLFLRDVLGFQTTYKTGLGWCAENGTVSLVIEQGTTTATLEIRCTDIQRDAKHLLQYESVTLLRPLFQQKERMEILLESDCGLRLRLAKILNEDDTGDLLPLPSTLVWDAHAKLSTQRILRIVPLSFREKARQQVTERAEYIAVQEGELNVTMGHAMQALSVVTKPFQRQALFDAMLQEGIDAEQYLNVVNND